MSDITIPPEAGLAMANEVRRQCGIMVSPAVARAAIRAALAVWPGVSTRLADTVNVEPRVRQLVLPLPQEKIDAEG